MKAALRQKQKENDLIFLFYKHARAHSAEFTYRIEFYIEFTKKQNKKKTISPLQSKAAGGSISH